MTRRIWPVCVLFVALAGCQETDPAKINAFPTGYAGTPWGLANNNAAGGAGAAQTKTGGIFTNSPRNLKPGDPLPEGYPQGEPPPGVVIPGAKKPADAPKTEEAAPADAPKTATLSEKEIAGIKELPEAEQAIALKQVVCLINSDSHLGSMGAPLKVEYEGKVGFLCCDGCKADFDKDPAAAFAKLEKK
jgi:YHS domain-containing protein